MLALSIGFFPTVNTHCCPVTGYNRRFIVRLMGKSIGRYGESFSLRGFSRYDLLGKGVYRLSEIHVDFA